VGKAKARRLKSRFSKDSDSEMDEAGSGRSPKGTKNQRRAQNRVMRTKTIGKFKNVVTMLNFET